METIDHRVLHPHPPSPQPAASVAPLVRATDLSRRWGSGAAAQLALDGVSLDVGHGELVAIVGPSGSGKSTLGSLIAGIDQPTAGSLVVDGVRIDRLSDDQRARWRAGNVGIVFQDFHLLPTLDARENVELALRFAHGRSGRRRRVSAAADALAAVGLATKAKRLPTQLSGGEQQRVAVARALVTRPRLIVADEPTGSLDREAGSAVFELLVGIAASGTAVVLITHDVDLAGRADRTVAMLDGRIVEHAVRSRRPVAATAEVR